MELIQKTFWTEKEKENEEYLKGQVDVSISVCQTSVTSDIIRAYDMRNGTRSDDKFKYLWEAYGMEFPSTIKHIPVLNSMFNSMIGEELLNDIEFDVTSIDQESIASILSEKKIQMLTQLNKLDLNSLQEKMEFIRKGFGAEAKELNQILSTKQRESLIEYFEKEWRSDLEIDAFHMVNFLIHLLGLRYEFAIMYNDLITSGREAYRVFFQGFNKPPGFSVINPAFLYVTKPSQVKFLKDCDRVVYKEKMSVADIIARYGHKMKETDLKELVNRHVGTNFEGDLEIMDSINLHHGYKDSSQVYRTLNDSMETVHYVEWKDVNKVPFLEAYYDEEDRKLLKRRVKYAYRQDRYEGIRIGDRIYVDMQKSPHPLRDEKNPTLVNLSINGAFYNDRNGEPYSIVLATEDISDKIDIMHYHWETLVALSGTKAIMVNFPDIPEFFGTDPMDRIVKWLGMVKMGAAVVDHSQEGAGGFNNMGDADLSLANSLDSITKVISFLYETASLITGVNRQRVGDIRPNDLVGNSQMAVNYSSVVTQPLTQLHYEVKKQALTDLVNMARFSYKKGFAGSYVLNKQKSLFTLMSDKFSLSTYNVNLVYTKDNEQKLGELKALGMEMVKNNMADIDKFFEAFTVDSLSDMKTKMRNSISRKDEGGVEELKEKLKMYEEHIQKLESETSKTGEVMNEVKKAELKLKEVIEKQKIQVDRERNQIQKNFNEKKLDLDKERVNLEKMQLTMSNRSKEVRDK